MTTVEGEHSVPWEELSLRQHSLMARNYAELQDILKRKGGGSEIPFLSKLILKEKKKTKLTLKDIVL